MNTHSELCLRAARYLRYHGLYPFHKCQYVVCELDRSGESPDAFGFGGSWGQLIEVKISRTDFLSDKNKHWRIYPKEGLGSFRSYLCPTGLIKPKDLPNNWGLLYINERNKIEVIKRPELQESNHYAEIQLISSILRRENIHPQVFKYRK